MGGGSEGEEREGGRGWNEEGKGVESERKGREGKKEGGRMEGRKV